MNNPITRCAQICALGLCLIPFLAATPQCKDCPNTGVAVEPTQIHYGPNQDCGGGVEVPGAPIRLHGPRAPTCPLFAIVEPTHSRPEPKLDFRFQASGTVTIKLLHFACRREMLFWLIPIGSSCGLTKSEDMGTIQNYIEFSCAAKPGGGK